MSVRSENLKRRKLSCLRCGKTFWTDRCHRVCKRCCSDTREPFVRPMVSAEGIALLGEYRLAGELATFDDPKDAAASESYDDTATEEVDA